MNIPLLEITLWIAQAAIGLSMCLCVWRMVIGPRAQDRILSLDAFYVCGMLQLLAFGMRTANIVYFEAALIMGMLGFVATVSLAKFLMRGEVIE